MRMYIALAVGACLGAGCGGKGGGSASLEGTWTASVNSICTVSATFDTHDDSYVRQFLCLRADGAQADAQADLELGTFDASTEGWIHFQPTQVSCPTEHHPVEDDSYSFQAGKLVILTPTETVSLYPMPASAEPLTMGAPLTYGCWGGGHFTAHPLQPL
jgi:hypothetical protein